MTGCLFYKMLDGTVIPVMVKGVLSPTPPPPLIPPNSPTNLRITSAVNLYTSASIAWDASTIGNPPITYEVVVNGTVRTTTASLAYTFTVAADGLYTITVTAIGADGRGGSTTIKLQVGHPQQTATRTVTAQRQWRSGVIHGEGVSRDSPVGVTIPANVHCNLIWFNLQANFATSYLSGFGTSRVINFWAGGAEGYFAGNKPNPWMEEVPWDAGPGLSGFVLRGSGWSTEATMTWRVNFDMEAHGIETYTYDESYVSVPEVYNTVVP